MRKKENTLSFSVAEAKLSFEVETMDGQDEVRLETSTGHELMEKLSQYAKNDYDTLFKNEEEHVNYALLKNIELTHEQADVTFKMYLDADDHASVHLMFHSENLMGKNAKKIALIRDILNFNGEEDDPVLQELLSR